MTLDSSSSHSIADERISVLAGKEQGAFCSLEQVLSGNSGTRSDEKSGLGKEDLSAGIDIQKNNGKASGDSSSWCYLMIHNKRVKSFEERADAYNKAQQEACHPECVRPYFIHKTPRFSKPRGAGGVKEEAVPTVSGLIFLQGNPDEIQDFLANEFPLYHLCRDCSTGKVARIPDEQMQPFMQITKASPEQIMILRAQYAEFAQNHTLLRVLSGPFKGQEGYLVRIVRDRKLVMDFGGLAVAIGGIHQYQFEEVKRKV